MNIEEPKMEGQENQPIQEKGKVIYAWCNKELGEFPKPGISHGICPECNEKIQPEIEMVTKAHAQQIWDMIKDLNVSLTRKLEDLQSIDHSLFIKKHAELEVTEENLPKIEAKLKEKFGL